MKELQQVIDDAKSLMARFEAEEADQSMSAEYHNLHELYQRAVKLQRAYTKEMMDLIESDASILSDIEMPQALNHIESH